LEALRGEGLLDPSMVAGLDEGEVVVRLTRADYARGAYVTTMMANRLRALHEAVGEGLVARRCWRRGRSWRRRSSRSWSRDAYVERAVSAGARTFKSSARIATSSAQEGAMGRGGSRGCRG